MKFQAGREEGAWEPSVAPNLADSSGALEGFG